VTQADIWNFLFVPEGEGRVVCGAVFASRDRAGRSFPFLTFLLLECQRVAPAPWLIPLKCCLFLDKTRQLLRQLRADLDWNSFRAKTEQLATEVEMDPMIETRFQDYLSRTTISEFWSGVVNTQPPAADDRAQPPRSEPGSRVGTGGRHFPLLKACNAESYDVPFWLELQARTSGASLNPLSTSIAFWNRECSRIEACALVSVGCPSSNLARFIVSPDVTDDAWDSGIVWSANRWESTARHGTGSPAYTGPDGAMTLRQYLDSVS